MKRRLFALALLLAGIFSGCQPPPRRVLARVLLARGAVQTFNPQGAARTLQLAEPLEAGSRLSVPAAAAAAVSLVPGVAALADGLTDWTLDALEMQKADRTVQARRARVTLRAGTLRFSVGSPPDRRIELEVQTAAGATLSAAPGSLFSVSMRDPKSARVTCARGAVGHFPGQGGPGSWILAGEFQEIGGASPAPPRPIIEDSAARREAADLFDAALALEDLQERQRNLTPFLP